MSTLRNQLTLMDEIRSKANINMVTCGHCGTILLHKMKEHIITCYGCKREMDVCDCPDFFYEGMPELDNEL